MAITVIELAIGILIGWHLFSPDAKRLNPQMEPDPKNPSTGSHPVGDE